MNTYLLVHQQPRNYTGTPETLAAWEAWFEQLEGALVDPGNSVLSDRGVAGDAGTALPLGGYSIINAENIEDAARLAQGCPIVADGGAVEVGRLTPRPGRQHPARTF
jgi:hypothetical protein